MRAIVRAFAVCRCQKLNLYVTAQLYVTKQAMSLEILCLTAYPQTRLLLDHASQSFAFMSDTHSHTLQTGLVRKRVKQIFM